MEAKLENYKKELAKVTEELETLPNGILVKRGLSYYQKFDGKENSLKKKPKLLRLYCRKKYINSRKKQLDNNISILLNSHRIFDNTTPKEMIHSYSSVYQEVSHDHFFHPSIEEWVSKSYRQNTYKIEECKYPTKNAVLLRSKSEVFIANLLEEYNIPYRYDAAFTLGKQVIYPDFVIKNPFSGKTFLWEHFGALNKERYEQRMNDKMDLFLKNGFIPFETLIYTFEFDIRNPHRLKDLIENIILQG